MLVDSDLSFIFAPELKGNISFKWRGSSVG